MVETHKGADAEEVEGLQVVGGAGCLGSCGHGVGRLILENDGDVLPGSIGSLDPMAGERLESRHGGRWHNRDRNHRWLKHWRWMRTSERELPQPGAIQARSNL
jgi:hypothetical protein